MTVSLYTNNYKSLQLSSCMNLHALRAFYQKHRVIIKQRLSDFSSLSPEQHFHELLFCLLTPASNAHRCWAAVKELRQLKRPTPAAIRALLRKYTRFHNQKAHAVMEAYKLWPVIQQKLSHPHSREVRDWLANNVRGLGLKESSHFLRNIGRSNNELAILDRHVLRNLRMLSIIADERIKSQRQYREVEQRFLALARRVRIPAEHLDLLFWSMETGEVFK